MNRGKALFIRGNVSAQNSALSLILCAYQGQNICIHAVMRLLHAWIRIQETVTELLEHLRIFTREPSTWSDVSRCGQHEIRLETSKKLDDRYGRISVHEDCGADAVK